MELNGTGRAWNDENPFFLMIVDSDKHVLEIDLGEYQWATTYAEWMRRPGHWLLCHKNPISTALVVVVNPGDQPYYTARHVGAAGSGGSNEIITYGIGKKQSDGEMVRLWVMPGGAIVGGEDVGSYGMDIVRALGPRQEAI